jgi:hypothetical protein
MSSSGLKAQLKSLLAAKEYRAAIVLLEASDLPEKKTYIARIQMRMNEEAKAREAGLKPVPEPVKEPVKAKPARRFSNSQLILMGGAVGLFLIIAIPLLNTYRNRYVDRMATTCETVYRDDWLNDRYTFYQWWAGCKDAAAAAMDTYGEEIRYCFDSNGQTDKLFMQCLADQDVYISARYLEAAPKERP